MKVALQKQRAERSRTLQLLRLTAVTLRTCPSTELVARLAELETLVQRLDTLDESVTESELETSTA